LAEVLLKVTPERQASDPNKAMYVQLLVIPSSVAAA